MKAETHIDLSYILEADWTASEELKKRLRKPLARQSAKIIFISKPSARGELPVNTTSFTHVGVMSGFGRSKLPEASHAPVLSDLSLVATGLLNEGGSLQARNATLEDPAVGDVLPSRALSKICEAIVQSVSVDMVQLDSRPTTVHVEPSEAVREVDFPVEADDPISVVVVGPSLLADAAAVEGLKPREFASDGAIMERSDEFAMRKRKLLLTGHDSAPVHLSEWIAERTKMDF